MRLYKMDMISTDLVCAEITLRHDGVERLVIVHEEMGGFQPMMDLFEQQLPGFMHDWWNKVVQPPMATNLTVVFQRTA